MLLPYFLCELPQDEPYLKRGGVGGGGGGIYISNSKCHSLGLLDDRFKQSTTFT